jgi:hypothetical protein
VTQPPILSPLQLQSAQTIQETTKTTEHPTDGAGGDSPTGTVTYSQNSQSFHGPIDTIYDTQSPEIPTERSTQNQTLIEATEEETGQDKGPPVEWSREECVELNFWEESELLILIEAYICS